MKEFTWIIRQLFNNQRILEIICNSAKILIGTAVFKDINKLYHYLINGRNFESKKCNYCGRCAFSCPTDAYETAPGYLLSFGGLFGNKISKGVTVLPFVEDQDTLFRICDAALEFFKENAVPGERFKFTIDRVGREKLDETLWSAFEGN